MRILVLSFYFEPDLCAGSFRNTSLIETLSAAIGPDDRIDVLTTAPNRYKSYIVTAPRFENRGNVFVNRIPVRAHESGLIDQSRAFVCYAFGVLRAIRGRNYDLVFASSSRLMTAVLGAFVSQRRKARYYIDFRDIFVDTIADVYAKSVLDTCVPLLRLGEDYAIKSAARINLISPGFLEYFEKIDASKQYRTFTGGIDSQKVAPCFDSEFKTSKREILYAGNIGAGQALHKIIADMAKQLGSSWNIRIIGDGGLRKSLDQVAKLYENVTIQAPVPREVLFEEYQKADVLFLHLDNLPAFEKVIPSKLYEYGASGKPILAGVRGYAAEFIKDNLENAEVFNPCDVHGLIDALDALTMGYTERIEFCEKYDREKVNRLMAADILDLADQDSRDGLSI